MGKVGTTVCQHGTPTDSFFTTGKHCDLCEPPIVVHTEVSNLSTESTDGAKLRIALLALKDFAEHGTRHDANPTGMMKPCGCFDSFKGDHWQSYIKSQDESVRERAKTAIKEISMVKEVTGVNNVRS